MLSHRRVVLLGCGSISMTLLLATEKRLPLRGEPCATPLVCSWIVGKGLANAHLEGTV